MTIKQAVSWLSQPGILAMIHDPTTKKAVQVAIKALSATDKNVGAKHGTNLAEVGTDCISRQDAIDALWAERMKHAEEMERNLETHSFALRADNMARRNRVEEDIEIISQLPSAQPKTGRWISVDAMFHGVPFYCSECGENTRDTVMGKPRWKFCPMCGAKMEGVDDE